MLILSVSSRSAARARPRGGSAFADLVTPALPRVFIDTTFAMPSGTVWNVSTASQLTNALALAVGGDIIVIANGVNLQGNFNLRARSDTDWLYIVDARVAAGTFPRPAGVGLLTVDLAARAACRARPSDFATPSTTSTLTSTAANILWTTDPGAAYYRFAGLEMMSPASVTGGGVALCDIRDQTASQGTLSAQPHHIVFDRCFIHGRAGVDTRRAILANGQYIAAVDCWIEEIHGAGFESCGFASYNGAGPFKIVNDEIQAATENILFGGAQPAVFGLVPSDIEVDLCHLDKDPAWIGLNYGIKDNYEHKNGSYARFQRSFCENSWQDGQSGNSLLFQPLEDTGETADWTAITDITLNLIRCKGVGTGLVIAGRIAFGTGLMPVTPLSRFQATNVLFEDVGLRTPANGFPTVNDGGRLLQLTGDFQNVVLDHITGKAPNHAIDFGGFGPGGATPNGTVIKRSLLGRGDFGIFGDTVAEGKVALDTYAGPAYDYSENALYNTTTPGANFNAYTGLPVSNHFTEEASVDYIDPSTDQWGLAIGSPYKGAGSDGKDLGCDVAALDAALANVVVPR
jgi:hypothetical protein